jgi:hypothetical protein
MHQYLEHYARELEAYSLLLDDPSALGFFVPERPPVDLEGRGYKRIIALLL